jgi:hypothetical protein
VVFYAGSKVLERGRYNEEAGREENISATGRFVRESTTDYWMAREQQSGKSSMWMSVCESPSGEFSDIGGLHAVLGAPVTKPQTTTLNH